MKMSLSGGFPASLSSNAVLDPRELFLDLSGHRDDSQPFALTPSLFTATPGPEFRTLVLINLSSSNRMLGLVNHSACRVYSENKSLKFMFKIKKMNIASNFQMNLAAFG